MVIYVSRRGAAAVVVMNSPPVNAIGQAMRQQLHDAFVAISLDDSIERVVLMGASHLFAAGADAREFNTDPVPPHLPDVIRLIEQCGKPCIAAIEGPALGGGYELALACTFRIATPDARIGLPEVTLGVVPGAGGTQRLPRLIGMAPALTLIPEGRIVDGKTALSLGMIDQLSDDPLQSALSLDLSALRKHVALSQRPRPAADPEAQQAAVQKAQIRMRGQEAPLRAIDLVALSAETDFDTGQQQERATFLNLRQSNEARALRHLFFSERGARRPDALASVAPVDISQAVVIGGGTMGSAIAYALVLAGIRAHIIETDVSAVERAAASVGKLFSGAVKRGLMSDADAAKRQANLTIAAGYDDLPPADLAIEAAIEDMATKKEIFSRLESCLSGQALLATNTSYLDINEIAAGLTNPERVLGLHFFSPAHIMRLLEIIRSDATSDTAMATAFALAKRLRKIPVVAGVCDGFIGNRILARYREIADVILIDGSLPWEIDEAKMEFGYTMGPYAAQDLSGLDIAHANRQRLASSRDPKRRYVTISDRMVEEGRLGRKASVGWYRYRGGGGATIDPLLEDLIVEEAHFAGITRRAFTADEIRERLLAAMINEACNILDEGIASKASDIDLVLVHGYGFPRWRGGLMHYAETIGFDTVLRQVESYAREDPLLWSPGRKLIELAGSNDRSA